MKPEVASACNSISQAYKHPELYTPQEVIDLWEEYCLGLYMNFNFTFIYCLRKPVYMAISEVYDDTVILFGGRYLIESYNGYYDDEDKMVWDLDTETYPFRDSRPIYKSYGSIIDFTDSSVKGIIICSEEDYMDNDLGVL